VRVKDLDSTALKPSRSDSARVIRQHWDLEPYNTKHRSLRTSVATSPQHLSSHAPTLHQCRPPSPPASIRTRISPP
jgi:hypothetical protein